MLKEYTHLNVNYLMVRLGITINALAGFIEIDPIDLWKFEQPDFEIVGNDTNYSSDLAKFANYFMVKLGDLVYADIESSGLYDENLFGLLVKEFKGERSVSRKKFNSSLDPIDNQPLTGDEFADLLHVAKHCLNNIQILHIKSDLYWRNRIKGSIEKDDFWEAGGRL